MHSFDQRLKIPLGVPACVHACETWFCFPNTRWVVRRVSNVTLVMHIKFSYVYLGEFACSCHSSSRCNESLTKRVHVCKSLYKQYVMEICLAISLILYLGILLAKHEIRASFFALKCWGCFILVRRAKLAFCHVTYLKRPAATVFQTFSQTIIHAFAIHH